MKKLLLSSVILATSMSLTYGQVGIGTTTPQETLHVNGGVRVSDLMPTASSSTNVSVDANGTLILSDNTNSPVDTILGKIGANGNAIKINGANCTRTSAGVYKITFNQPLTNKDYYISLTVSNSESLIISYDNQNGNGFDVVTKKYEVNTSVNFGFFSGNITTTPVLTLTDSEFMFKVEKI